MKVFRQPEISERRIIVASIMNKETMMNAYRGESLLLLVTLLAAAGWFVSKYALQELPPAGFLALRFLLASLIFLPFSYAHLRQMSRLQIRAGFMVGCTFGLNLFLWIQGVTHSQHFGEGAFLLSLSMLIAPLISWMVFRHQPSRLLWLSLVVAAMGLYWLNAGKAMTHWSVGSAFFAAASLMAALFFVLNNQFAKSVPTLPLTTLQLATAGVLCGIYSFWMEDWHMPQMPSTWGWLVVATLLITNFRYLLQTYAQKLSDIGNAAMIMVLEPVWTLIFSVVLLGEHLTWQKSLGGTLILLALLLYRLPLKWLSGRFRQPEIK